MLKAHMTKHVDLSPFWTEDKGWSINSANEKTGLDKRTLSSAKNLGFQVDNPKKKEKSTEKSKKSKTKQPSYLPTEKGKPFSKFVLQEANGNNTTVQQLRWYPSIIKKLVNS